MITAYACSHFRNAAGINVVSKLIVVEYMNIIKKNDQVIKMHFTFDKNTFMKDFTKGTKCMNIPIVPGNHKKVYNNEEYVDNRTSNWQIL